MSMIVNTEICYKLKDNLAINKDYLLINKDVWEYL
jgi:hypothetical protein